MFRRKHGLKYGDKILFVSSFFVGKKGKVVECYWDLGWRYKIKLDGSNREVDHVSQKHIKPVNIKGAKEC